MADGSIRIAVEVDGKKIDTTSKDIDRLGDAAKRSGQGVGDAENQVKKYGDETEKAGSKTKKFVTALGLVALGAAAFNVLRKSLDTAISRFDTLNRFPKVLEQMGFSAEDSQKAMDNLSDGIDGLPTKLDEVVATAQGFAVMTKDLDGAVDTTLALNNAFLASGSNSADAARGLEQYTQMFAKSEVDITSWRTLQETMGVALDKVAESFKMTGDSAQNDLYEALKSGKITFREFNDRIIELNDGVGGFAELAKTNSAGLATSFSNLRNAAARGLADIIKSFDNLSKRVTGNDIATNIDKLKVVVNTAFKIIGTAIESAAPIVVFFADVIKMLFKVVEPLTPLFVGAASALAAWLIIKKINDLLKIQAVYTAAVTGATKLFTGATNLSTVAITAKTAAAKLLSKAMSLMGGPIGLAVTAVGALVGGTIALIKWFSKTSEESQKLKKDIEKLGEATDDLTGEINGNIDAYEKSQKKIESNAMANSDLIDKIEALSEVENKSAAEKKQLAEYVELLNQNVDDLNLSYGEEADMLNMTIEQLKARTELQKEQDTYNEAIERQNEIFRELTETQEQLNAVVEKREEIEKGFEEGTVKTRERKEAVKELDEQEQLLRDTMEGLGEQWEITNEQMITSSERADEIMSENIHNQILLFEDLSQSQQDTFNEMKSTYDELVENATNAFDKMNDKAKVTGEEMIANLEHNQEMTARWGENIAELYHRAGKNSIDDGFIKYLEGLGPSAAAEVQEVVNMSDEQLKRYSDLMKKGGDVAGESLKTALGEELSDAVDVMKQFVDDGSKSLRDKIKQSKFDEIGKSIPEGTAEGIEKGTKDVEDATAKMAEQAEKAARKGLETHSPSRVFMRIGNDTTDGMTLGITKGVGKVLMVMRKLALDMIIPFRSQPSQFRSVGVNAMAGLNAGLNAGAGRVMSTARAIAGRVAATMKKALEIHSPSRLFKREVGLPIPQGVALGIEDGADSAYKAIQGLADGIVLRGTPEAALGNGRMAYGNSYSTSNNVNKTENKYNTTNMEGLFNGANFHIRNESDIPKLAKELNDYIKGSARSKGVVTF